MSLGQHRQKPAAEQAREHLDGTRKRGRDEIQRSPSSDRSAARHDHVHVRMMREGGAPGVQHCGDADPGPQMLGIGGDRERRLGRGLHQQIVDHSLVLVGDVGDRRRQRVDDMEVADGQQLGLALGEPLRAPPRPGTLGQCRLRQEL